MARAKSSVTVLATNTVSASVSTASADATPSRRNTAAATMPSTTGPRKLRRRLSSEARRHAMSGPTPIKKMSDRKSGMFTELKNGAPTLTFTPRTASDRSGTLWIVRPLVEGSAATRKTLFKRKVDSRETTESSVP